MGEYLKGLEVGQVIERLEAGEMEFERVLADLEESAQGITRSITTREFAIEPEKGRQPWAAMYRKQELTDVVEKGLNDFGQHVGDYLPALLLYAIGKMQKILASGSIDTEAVSKAQGELDKLGQLIKSVASLRTQAVTDTWFPARN